MSLKRTIALAQHLAAAIKTNLDGGFLYVYAGPPPATSDEALDLVTLHTELVKISISGGATGLTFDAPVAGVLSKAAAETWSGTNAFDGVDDADSALAPTFYRFCKSGDNGRGAANSTTGDRIQGTAGGPSSGADLQFGTATLTAGNTQPVGAYSITID